MYRFCNALVVEESKRRSLKTSSIHTAAVKWFLLSNTDKAWAHISVFICVQDICPLFTAQCFLPPQPARSAHLMQAGSRVSPDCCLSIMENAAVLWVCQPFGSSLQAWTCGSHQQRLCPQGTWAQSRDIFGCWDWDWDWGWGSVYYCQLVSGGQGCSSTSCNARDSPSPLPQVPLVPRSRNAGLEIWLLLL